MATIQRSLLIEAPVHLSYRFWCDLERLASFAAALRGGAGAGRAGDGGELAVPPHLAEQMEDRFIRCRYTSGPEREALLTFAPLEGNATWFTFTLEYEPAVGESDIAGRLSALSRRIDRELRAAREAIEASETGPLARTQEHCRSA